MRYPTNDWSDADQIRRLFSFQARHELGPKWGTRSMAQYQVEHIKSHDHIVAKLKDKGFYAGADIHVNRDGNIRAIVSVELGNVKRIY